MHTTPDTQRHTFSLLGYMKQATNDIARTIGEDPGEVDNVYGFVSDFDIQAEDRHIYNAVLLFLIATSDSIGDLHQRLPHPEEPVSPSSVARTVLHVARREVVGDRVIDAAEWKRNAKLKEQAGEALEVFSYVLGLVCQADRSPDPTHIVSELLTRPYQLLKDVTKEDCEKIAALIAARAA